MKKTHIKYLAILSIILIGIFIMIGTVKAEEIIEPEGEEMTPMDPTITPTNPSDSGGEALEVSHRDMALASALSYLKASKDKTISNSNMEIVTYFNEKFNLYSYGTTDEINEWKVVDYRSRTISERGMTAFTLQKDNNILVVFRGTDTEAVEDVIGYGIKNYHAQEGFAEEYILKIASKYAKEGNFNFYITGHSLGGYLAGICGATLQKAIDNANSGKTDWVGWNMKKTYKLEDFLENGSFEKYKNITLKQVVSFNGMGMEVSKIVKEALNSNSFLKKLVGNNYTYEDQTKKIEILKELGNEGKLINYYNYGDAVSGLGIFYGEMRRITPSIDAITNRRENIYEKAFGRLDLAQKTYKAITQIANPWNTEIAGAKKLYDIDSILMHLLLTHEPDSFASIMETKEQQAKSTKINTPSVAIMKENQSELKNIKSETKIETNSSITLKAITSFASAKKYEWFESTDKVNWTLVKAFTLDNEEITPTNRFSVDINQITEGTSKYYKVVSHYDDKYVSSKYDETAGKYVVKGEAEHGKGTVEQTIEIKRKKANLIQKTGTFFKNIFTKIINGIKGIFSKK